MKESQMIYVLGVLQNTACEDIHLNTDQVYDILIQEISRKALRATVIGQYKI